MLKLRSNPKHDREREHGQIIVLFALVLVVILAFTSLVIDIGLLRNDRQTLVNAMDSGALAGGTMMPVDGTVAGAAAATNALITKTVNANYPGLAYTISYRCLIGADPATGAPLITRDIPAVCNPSHALGHAPVASDFHGAGLTRSSACDPFLGDICNTVVVAGAATTQFSFGRVVGVAQGSTGTVTSAACNGPCGEPPQVPVDVVLILDRTYSMVRDGNQSFLAPAARAVLSAYDPTLQRVALGFIGPSKSSDAGLCPGSPAVHGLIVTPPIAAIPPVPAVPPVPPRYRSSTTDSTVTGGRNPSYGKATSIRLSRPSNTSQGDFLIAQVLYNSGSSLSISMPTGSGSGWTLYGRQNIGTGTLGQAIYYKFVDNNEPTSYTWGFGSSVEAVGGIMRYTGVHTSSPIDANGAGNSGNSNSLVARSVTTVHAETKVLTFFGHESSTSLSEPTNMTRRYSDNFSGGSNQALTVSADDVDVSPVGATGDKTSSAGSTANWIAQSLALRPVPGTPEIPGVPGVPSEYGSTVPDDIPKWIPIGLSGVGAPINESFKNTDGTLNNGSQIVKAINCFDFSSSANNGYSGTTQASPIAMARSYLNSHVRTVNGARVKQGIILETDGRPETASPVTPDNNPNYTCAEARRQADLAKADDIEVYTIGFGNGTIGPCPDGSGAYRNKTAADLLSDMAFSKSGVSSARCDAAENKDGDTFYCATSGADLKTVFTQAATELAGIRTHLVQLYPIPVVSSIGPSGGSHLGGNTITVTGKFFTGATAVKFGGGPAGSFTIVSDNSITVTVPAGTAGQTVDVTVTTPGGTSKSVVADRYTYN